ncbi:hypothetical protein FO519_003500 [Halicephalobus sp. NKZ332]|nr:hypothetical protein FO519_003500 [Halicephalobus sp. NKZ332]
MLFKILVLGLLEVSVMGFQGYSNQWRGVAPGQMNQVTNSDFNFLEYSDVDSHFTEDEGLVDGKEMPQGAGGETSNSILGTRETDEFNPETMFQDSNEDGDCKNFPNQTMIRPHFFSCNSPVRPPILVVHDSAVANSTGDYKFPLDFTQTVRFFFDVTSFATRRYDNLRAEVYLYRRKTGWLGCGWLFLPTFGIIDNYDVCEDNLSCPIYPGRQVIEVTLNPTIAFSGIFKMIHNKNYPYQLIIRLDKKQKVEEFRDLVNGDSGNVKNKRKPKKYKCFAVEEEEEALTQMPATKQPQPSLNKFVFEDDEEAIEAMEVNENSEDNSLVTPSPATVRPVLSPTIVTRKPESFKEEPAFETISEDEASVEFPVNSYQGQQQQHRDRLVTVAPLTPSPPINRPKLRQIHLPKAEPSVFQTVATTTLPPEVATAKRDSQNRPLVLSPEHCSQIKHYADQYGVSNPLEWVHNNCEFAKMYLPTASCEEIDILISITTFSMSLPSNIKILKNPPDESYWKDIFHLVTDIEKWFNTPNDYDIWRQGFGEDFVLYVAVDVEKNKAVGSASGVDYRTLDGNPFLTCNGMVCVDPEYRGQNIGLVLSNLVMGKEVGLENKSLIAVPSMSPKYSSRFGFSIIPEDNMTDVEFEISEIDLKKVVEIPEVIKNPETDDWKQVFDFDRKMLKFTQRDKFLKLFCTQENSYFKIAVNPDSSVSGFCLIRANLSMKTLYTGPFYATSLPVAEALFLEALKSIPDLSNFRRIRLAFYSSSGTLDLLKKVAPEADIEKSEHFLQFTKEIVPIQGELIYGVTENDVSFI